MAISVIIPTLNEAGCLAQTLHSVRAQQPQEILIVDGGSTDTTAVAAAGADQFLNTARGRANQMNAGAAVVRGEILLFLHADCRLEEGALVEAERCLSQPGVAAGCFRMTIEARGIFYRMIDASATARVRLTGLIYGDQGLFVRRRVFEELGGFPRLRLLEDVSFSRLLRRRGRMVVVSRRIFVSPRRWQRSGIIRQSLRNWGLLMLAAVGVHPDRLADFYPAVR